MPQRHSRALAALVLAGVLGGSMTLLATCGDGPRTTTVRRIEDPWAIAQGAGLLPVIIRGRPAFAADGVIQDAVLRQASATISWSATPPLAAETAGEAGARLRIVFVFNDAGSDPCTNDPRGGEPKPLGEITLAAGFCDGTTALVRVDGRLARSDGTNDRRFARLVAQATRELLSPPAAPRP